MENHQQEHHHHHQFLPYEILTDILSRLPADSIIRFRRVCKAWRSIVEEDPVFRDMHIRGLIASSSSSATTTSLGFVKLKNVDNTTHYVCFAEYKHHDDQKVMKFKKWRLPAFKGNYSRTYHQNFTIVGSCNGLICISVIRYSDRHHLTLVCNPLTGEVVNLSQDPYINSVSLVGIGFGYLPSTNEYKIVRMYASLQERRLRLKHVQVYTLGSGKWRSIVPQISNSWSDISFMPIPRYANPESKLGVTVNGALYFNNLTDIVSFDLAKEEFRVIVSPPPTVSFNMDIGIGGLGVLEGRLCATRCSISSFIRDHSRSTSTTMINTDLWVLMEEEEKDDDKEMEDFPWIKKFSLPPQSREDGRGMYNFEGYRPLGTISPPPRILLQSNPGPTKGIVSYNPETDHLCCRDIDGAKCMVIPYVKSFVSLKALGENTAKKNLGCC